MTTPGDGGGGGGDLGGAQGRGVKAALLGAGTERRGEARVRAGLGERRAEARGGGSGD